jgi:hypothetical protein
VCRARGKQYKICEGTYGGVAAATPPRMGHGRRASPGLRGYRLCRHGAPAAPSSAGWARSGRRADAITARVGERPRTRRHQTLTSSRQGSARAKHGNPVLMPWRWIASMVLAIDLGHLSYLTSMDMNQLTPGSGCSF